MGERFYKNLHECLGTKCFVEYMRTKYELYFFLNMQSQRMGKIIIKCQLHWIRLGFTSAFHTPGMESLL